MTNLLPKEKAIIRQELDAVTIYLNGIQIAYIVNCMVSDIDESKVDNWVNNWFLKYMDHKVNNFRPVSLRGERMKK